ncbi:MAG: RNA 2',3'-cyclic phosphodiesterase [Burkholderiaceae bacterium]|nr:RNA 2',3'-cyclic phosphodiesterase [Burkholderiaceae bacterium]
MGDTREPLLRCFVALWPDPQAAARLDAIARELAGTYPQARPVPRANLHLTLAFIGALATGRAQGVAARLQTLDATPITWMVDRIDRFDGPRVAWAGGPAPAALTDLVQRVQALLDAAGVPFDRRPYLPHVTLLRHLPPGTTGLARVLTPPIAWRAGRAVLLQSAFGRYVEVAASS